MKQLLSLVVTLIIFSTNIGNAQTLSAKMISFNEVELEIINPNRQWFFMPYTDNALDYYMLLSNKKNTTYLLFYIIYEGNEESECNMIIGEPHYYREKFDKIGSGYFTFEKEIKKRYKIHYRDCEYKELKKENMFIQFVIVQKNIHNISYFKNELKDKNNIFSGELYSNKIPLKLKE
ncbi:hypothetical protein [Avrilella dinanensis]|uniref:hypothetical protein n=1 Tax=Avrilella dinanensis TaxID=2008672 RepID=UPI0024091E79|nr:hypothetical protein [Avrilella dinanensis]